MTAKTPWFCAAAVLLAMCCSGVPAFGMNKCTSPEGGVTYQDDTCTLGKGEKANIPHYKPPPPAGTPATPVPAAVTPAAVASATAPASQPKTKGLPEDAVVHTGPRGGRYILLPSGKKRYLPKVP